MLIEKKVAAQEVSDWNQSQNERKMEFEQAEQQFVDSFLDSADTDGFTDEQIEDAITTLRNKFGFESSRLNTLKASTVDAETRRDQEAEIKQLISLNLCLLYTSPSPRDRQKSRMPSSA